MSAEAKAALRRTVLARRDGSEAALRAGWSAAIRDHLAALLAEEGGTISLFLPIRSEADLEPLGDRLIGRDLCLPVVLDRETITFRRWLPGAPLERAGFGTSGPGADAPTVDPDLMIVPLAAFDGAGNRLGYGAGHYDRAIARLAARGHHPRLIGAAFALQRVDAIPAEPHDRRLDMVVTEDGPVRFGGAGG